MSLDHVTGLVVICLVAMATGVEGSPQLSAALNRTLADPAVRGRTVAAAGRSTVNLKEPCPSADFKLLDEVSVIVEPVLDSAGVMVAGAWSQRISETGCGKVRTLNVLAFIKERGTLATMPLLPGSTHAGPTLQKDAANYAFISAAVAKPGCQDGYVSDTAFLGYDAAAHDVPKKPWRERWSVNFCGSKLEVALRFRPDATGTQVVADPAQPHS